MGKLIRDSFRKRIPLICLNVILILLFIASLMISNILKNTLISQQTAERWSSNGQSYGQVSVFLSDGAGLTSADINTVVSSIDSSLEQASVSAVYESENSPLWTFGYSSESTLSVEWEGRTAEVSAVGVGENFFMFHPLRLKSGSYFYGSDLMQDRVVIDERLAWQLFGATNVAGFEMKIGEKSYIIAGVVVPEGDFASVAAYGEKPLVYLPYAALALNDEEARITSLELLLPSPINSFARETAGGLAQTLGINERDYSIIDNTNRYSALSLFAVMGDFGVRSMRQVGFTLPYWENAARMTEDYLALIMIISFLLLVVPAVSLVRLVIWLWRNRTWRAIDLKLLVEDKIAARRSAGKAEKS